MAQFIGKTHGLPVETNIPLRKKKIKSQGSMTRSQRHRNLQGAYVI